MKYDYNKIELTWVFFCFCWVGGWFSVLWFCLFGLVFSPVFFNRASQKELMQSAGSVSHHRIIKLFRLEGDFGQPLIHLLTQSRDNFEL